MLNQSMNSVFSSVRWSIVTNILKKIITFVLFLYIASIFKSDELGIYREFAVIISFISGISIFSNTSLIIVEKDRNILLQSLGFVIIISVISGLILMLFAKPLGDYYHSDILSQLLRFSIPFVLLESLRTLIKADFQKKMMFKFLSLYETYNVLFYTLVAFVFIPFFRNIKLFIVIFYFGNLVELIFLIIKYKAINSGPSNLHKVLSKTLYRDSFSLIKKHFHFLFFSTASTSINSLLLELPILILGLYFLPEQIGNYYIAFQLIIMPVSLITMSLSQVFFSRFSSLNIEDYSSRLKELYQIEFKLIIPLFLMFAFAVREWVAVFFVDKNIVEIQWIVYLLFFKGMVLLIMNPVSSFFAILKKPQIEFYWSIIALVVSNLLVYLLRNQEFITVLSAFIALSFFIYLSFNLIVFRQIHFSLKYFLKQLSIMFIVLLLLSLFYLLSSFVIKEYIANLTDLQKGIIQSLIAIIISLFYFLIADKFSKRSLTKMIHQFIKR